MEGVRDISAACSNHTRNLIYSVLNEVIVQAETHYIDRVQAESLCHSVLAKFGEEKLPFKKPGTGRLKKTSEPEQHSTVVDNALKGLRESLANGWSPIPDVPGLSYCRKARTTGGFCAVRDENEDIIGLFHPETSTVRDDISSKDRKELANGGVVF